MRFGVCSGPENLAVLEDAGYDYVELAAVRHLQPEQPEEEILPPLRAAFAASRLKPEVFNVLLPGGLKVVGPEADPARQERYLESAFSRARALGGQVMVFGSGGARRIPPGWPAELAWAEVSAFLTLAGAAAKRYEMQVVIEPLNQSECNLVTSVAEAYALVRELNYPSVGALSDLYHITQEGQRYAETEEAGPLLWHVHVAGAQDRRAPIAEDEECLRDYFAAVKRSGYDGRISIEGRWDDLPGQASPSLNVLRRAWDEA